MTCKVKHLPAKNEIFISREVAIPMNEMRKAFFLLCFVFLLGISYVQADWTKQYTYDADWAGATNLVPFSDGGYLLVGNTFPSGGLLVRIDSAGNLVWHKAFQRLFIRSQSVVSTSDDGFILAGLSSTVEPYVDVLVILRFDSNGNIIWEKNYSYAQDNNLYIASLAISSDGGLFITGSHFSGGAWIVRTDLQGNILWQRTYKCISCGLGRVKITFDGGFVAAGSFLKRRDTQVWVVREDINRQIVFQKRYTSPDTSSADDIVPYLDGYAVIGHKGWDKSNGWLLLLRSNGAIRKQFLLGGPKDDGFRTISVTEDNTLIMAGGSLSYSDSVAGWVVLKPKHGPSTQYVFSMERFGFEAMTLIPGGGFTAFGFSRESGIDHFVVASTNDFESCSAVMSEAEVKNSSEVAEKTSAKIIDDPFLSPIELTLVESTLVDPLIETLCQD